MHKNENKLDEMQDIVGFLHQYVPGHNDDPSSMLKPHKITSGGDYLTFERHKKAQELHADGRTPSKRLEGLIPNMEFFHLQAEWNLVIWKCLFKTTSHKDIGTLYAARNAVNARNVTQDPGNNFYAAQELLNKYTLGYILAGTLHFFQMESTTSGPSLQKLNQTVFYISVKKEERFDLVIDIAKQFIQEYTDYQFPKLDESAPVS